MGIFDKKMQPIPARLRQICKDLDGQKKVYHCKCVVSDVFPAVSKRGIPYDIVVLKDSSGCRLIRSFNEDSPIAGKSYIFQITAQSTEYNSYPTLSFISNSMKEIKDIGLDRSVMDVSRIDDPLDDYDSMIVSGEYRVISVVETKDTYVKLLLDKGSGQKAIYLRLWKNQIEDLIQDLQMLPDRIIRLDYFMASSKAKYTSISLKSVRDISTIRIV